MHVFDSLLFVLTASTQKSIDNFHEISRRSQSLISNCLFCSLFHRAEQEEDEKSELFDDISRLVGLLLRLLLVAIAVVTAF